MIAVVLMALALQGDSARLHHELDRAVAQLAAVERQALSSETAARRAAATQGLSALLDTVVLQRKWGGNHLRTLRRNYPGSVLLLEYDAKYAAKEQRWTDALQMREQMIRVQPRDTSTQRAYAELLERVGRLDDARHAYLRWLETVPESIEPFRALLRLQHDHQDLLERIRRYQIRLPDSKALKDREIELTHKLGRQP